MLLAVRVQNQDGGGPGDVVFPHQILIGGFHLHRHKVKIHELSYTFVRVRHGTHLLAANSLGVEKVQEDWLLEPFSGLLSLRQTVQPAYVHGHKYHSFPWKAAHSLGAIPE